MRWDSMFIAGHGAAYGASIPADVAIANGDYDAAAAAASGQLAVVVAADHESALDLAVAASRDALGASGYAPADIGATFYTFALHPGVEAYNPAGYLQRELGIPAGRRPPLTMSGGCTAAIQAVELACALLHSGDTNPAALVAAGEIAPPSIFHDRWAADLELPFGDAATAVVVSRERGPFRLLATGASSAPELEALHRGSEPLIPQSRRGPIDLVKRVGDFTAVNSKRAANEGIGHAFRAAIHEATTDAGVALADVDHVMLPFSGEAVLDQKYRGWVQPDVPVDRTRPSSEFSRTVGHLSASDPLAALNHLDNTGQLRSGQRVLLVADGAGWTTTALLLEVVA